MILTGCHANRVAHVYRFVARRAYTQLRTRTYVRTYIQRARIYAYTQGSAPEICATGGIDMGTAVQFRAVSKEHSADDARGKDDNFDPRRMRWD